MYHHWMVELFLINEETDMPEQKQKKKQKAKRQKKIKVRGLPVKIPVHSELPAQYPVKQSHI